MENNASIIQLVFNTDTMKWTMSLEIRGESTNVSITFSEASSLLSSMRQGDAERVRISTVNGMVYYVPVTKK